MGDHASRGPTPPRWGFSATWSLLVAIYMLCGLPVRVKTFSTHVVVKKCHVVRKMAGFTHGMSNVELDVL